MARPREGYTYVTIRQEKAPSLGIAWNR